MSSHEEVGSDFVSIVVADSSRIHTQLLADALRNDRGLQVVAEATNSDELLAAVTRVPIDVVVISHNLDNQPGHGYLGVARDARAPPPDQGCHLDGLFQSADSARVLSRRRPRNFLQTRTDREPVQMHSAESMKGRSGRAASISTTPWRRSPSLPWFGPPITKESNSSPHANARLSSMSPGECRIAKLRKPSNSAHIRSRIICSAFLTS